MVQNVWGCINNLKGYIGCELYKGQNCAQDGHFDADPDCREGFTRQDRTGHQDWYDDHTLIPGHGDMFDATRTAEFWSNKIANYCGSDGKGNSPGNNYQSAPGKDDAACAGLRKQPETASHKVVAGMECNSGDALCDAMKTTTDFKRQPNDCWWAGAREVGQFRIPHSEECLGFVDCSINIDDSELILHDEARATFQTSCGPTGGGGGGGEPDPKIEDAICEQSVKCQLKKKWKRFVAKLENKLPEHLKSSAEKIAIIAIGGIVAIILILIVQQSQNTETRFKDLERAMLSMRRRRR